MVLALMAPDLLLRKTPRIPGLGNVVPAKDPTPSLLALRVLGPSPQQTGVTPTFW